MKLGFLLLADASEAINGKVYVLGGGWNVLRFPTLPQNWNISIALGVDVAWDETNQPHSLELVVENPDGAVVTDEFSASFETGRPPGLPPGQEQRVVVSLVTKATLSAAGPHAAVARVNGDEIGRTRFYVVRVPGVDQPAA